LQSQKDTDLEKRAREGMGADERTFNTEAPVEQATYLWSDKYQPRKPRYFNRVHTVCPECFCVTILCTFAQGFEWNKYNQTHYDLDNPPPKIVQGYRFNVCFVCHKFMCHNLCRSSIPIFSTRLKHRHLLFIHAMMRIFVYCAFLPVRHMR
jgi:hypothetical protein